MAGRNNLQSSQPLKNARIVPVLTALTAIALAWEPELPKILTPPHFDNTASWRPGRWPDPKRSVGQRALSCGKLVGIDALALWAGDKLPFGLAGVI